MKRLKDMPAIKDWYDPTHYVANRIASAEGIGTWLGVNNGILMWLWDEIGRALDTPEHKRPANINAMITAMMILYTSANDEYDPNLRADVKNTKPTIEQPNFILYGTSTKEKMFEGFSAGNLEDGLLGRLLIFEGNDDWDDIEQEDVHPVTQSLVDQAHWWFCQRANRINPQTPAPKTVDVTSEAKTLFRQLADTKKQIRKEKNAIKDALWGRVVALSIQMNVNDDKLEEAKALAEKLLAEDPTSHSVKRLRATIALYLDDYPAAEKLFEELLLADPSETQNTNGLALALCEQDSPDKLRRALAYAAENAQKDSDNSEYLGTLGWVLFKAGQMEQSANALRQSAASGQINAATAYYLARLAVKAGRVEEARQLLGAAIQGKSPFAKRRDAVRLLESLEVLTK